MPQLKLLESILFEHGIADPSIYSFEVLLEDRLSFIKAKYNGKMNSVVDTLSQIDPTPNKKYTEWLTERHLKGDNVFNPDVRQGLHFFSKAKSTAHDTNIKNHDVTSMLDVAHMSKVQHEIGHTKSDSLEKMYDKDGVVGYRVPSKESSIENYGYGRKHSTNWCTSVNGANNMFDSYDGDKYTMHMPNGHFLQFHHDTNQCKDPTDSEIDFHTDKRYGPYKEHVREFMEQTSKHPGDHSLHESRFGISKERFDHHAAYYDESDDHEIAVVKNASKHVLDDRIFGKLLRSGYTAQLSRNPFLTHDQMGKLMGEASLERVATSPSLKGEHADKVFQSLLNESNDRGTYFIGRMHNLEPKHIDTLIEGAAKGNNDHYDALSNIAESNKYKFTDDQIRSIHSGVSGGPHLIAHKVAINQKIPSDVLPRAVKQYEFDIRNGFDAKDVGDFAKHNDLTHEHMDSLVNAFTSRTEHMPVTLKTAESLYEAPQLTHEHSAKISDSIAKKATHIPPVFAYHNQGMPHDHLVHILKSHPIEDTNIQGYIQRRDAKSSVVEELAKKNNIPTTSGYLQDYRGLKDFPKEKFSEAEHAPYVAMRLDKHPSANKDHITGLISGLEKWSADKNITPSNKMIENILNHPNVNASHINRILGNWGNDFNVHDTVSNHAKVPPSISKRIHNSFFEAE